MGKYVSHIMHLIISGMDDIGNIIWMVGWQKKDTLLQEREAE